MYGSRTEISLPRRAKPLPAFLLHICNHHHEQGGGSVREV